MSDKIEVRGQSLELGEAISVKLDPTMFHADDQDSARVLCSLQGFVGVDHEDVILQNAQQLGEGWVTVTAGKRAARLLLK